MFNSPDPRMPELSIIIPVLNEQKFLAAQREPLTTLIEQGHEVIIVDGGSADKSLHIAGMIGCKTFVQHPSRGAQLHFGALQSTKKILLFLHADTILPSNAVTLVGQALAPPRNHWGHFSVAFSNPRPMFRIIAWFMNKRSRLTGMATGDQAIFIKRKCYFDCGGFPEYPIMEDIALSKRLGKITLSPVCLPDKVISSSRKWEVEGILKTIATMWSLRLLFFLGVPANKLAKLYYT